MGIRFKPFRPDVGALSEIERMPMLRDSRALLEVYERAVDGVSAPSHKTLGFLIALIESQLKPGEVDLEPEAPAELRLPYNDPD